MFQSSGAVPKWGGKLRRQADNAGKRSRSSAGDVVSGIDKAAPPPAGFGVASPTVAELSHTA